MMSQYVLSCLTCLGDMLTWTSAVLYSFRSDPFLSLARDSCHTDVRLTCLHPSARAATSRVKHCVWHDACCMCCDWNKLLWMHHLDQYMQGLGKTITALSLVLSTKGIRPAALPGKQVTTLPDARGRHASIFLCYAAMCTVTCVTHLALARAMSWTMCTF